MRIFQLIPIVTVGLALGPGAFAQSSSTVRMQNLEGRYERTGVVDRAIEAQYKGLGLVLVEPALIDELILFPQRGTREDTEFLVQKRGNSDYLLILPKANVTRALTDLGSVVEMPDGSLALRRTVTITGEGVNSIYGDQQDRFSKIKRDGGEWLVVETRIEWTRRSWFKSKKVEYRSLVSFHLTTDEPTSQPKHDEDQRAKR